MLTAARLSGRVRRPGPPASLCRGIITVPAEFVNRKFYSNRTRFAELRFEKDRASLPALRPYLPEYGAAPHTALLEDSGETSFSKLKRCFNFEEEEQRNNDL